MNRNFPFGGLIIIFLQGRTFMGKGCKLAPYAKYVDKKIDSATPIKKLLHCIGVLVSKKTRPQDQIKNCTAEIILSKKDNNDRKRTIHFVAGLWSLWLYRNHLIFTGSVTQLNMSVKQAQSWVQRNS